MQSPSAPRTIDGDHAFAADPDRGSMKHVDRAAVERAVIGLAAAAAARAAVLEVRADREGVARQRDRTAEVVAASVLDALR